MTGFGNPKKKKRPSIEEARRLSLNDQKKTAHQTRTEAGGMLFQSRLNSRDGQPMIDFEWKNRSNRGELTLPEAFEHALGVIEVAIAAESDSLILEFVTKILGAEKEMAGMLILEFRKFREANPKRFKSWRGQALTILQAAETAEADQFLRDFLQRIQDETETESETEIDIESILEEFQNLRELRRNSAVVRGDV